mmetsp:Transcript_93389/g.300659  ORF Transcript_93389/g.300659 Transcript_93389/m.300659 type:complete len:235 (-) Transcript_93389:399-1103(-)
MYVMLNCRLPDHGHIFEIQLRIDGFHRLEVSQHWIFQWLRLLRARHEYLPGEEDHFLGTVEAGGEFIDIAEPTPRSQLPGQIDCSGEMCYADSGDMYKGEWRSGKHCGRGRNKYANGDVYTGEWEEHHREGKGKHIYADGALYDGQWHQDRRHGQGSYRNAGGDVYTGQWLADERHGQGTFRCTQGVATEGRRPGLAGKQRNQPGRPTLRLVYEGRLDDAVDEPEEDRPQLPLQ